MTHRVQALFLLAALAGPARAASPVEAAIDALLHDDSLKVRTQAAIILGQRGGVAAIPALRQAVAGDDSAAVRIAAVSALAKLHARVARPTLMAARATNMPGPRWALKCDRAPYVHPWSSRRF